MKVIGLFLVVVAFAASFLVGFGVRAQELGIKTFDIGDASSMPVLAHTTGVNFPVLSAQGVIAVDADSNITLYEKNADQELLPASTTKIVTALTALDYYKSDQVLTVYDTSVEGQKMGLLKGENMTFENLLNGLL